MNSKLNDLNFYDEVLADLIANASTEALRTDKKIYLKWFDPDRVSNMVYYHIAKICSDVYKFPIYINTSFGVYIKFLFKHWKQRKQFKWIRNTKVPLEATPVQAIIDHVEVYREMRPEANLIWKNILDTYYEPKVGEKE